MTSEKKKKAVVRSQKAKVVQRSPEKREEVLKKSPQSRRIQTAEGWKRKNLAK